MPVVWSITPATSPFLKERTEMLRQHNFHQQQLLSEQVAFVVRRMTVDYLAPARLDEQLEVQSEITCLRGASLTFAQRIVNSDGVSTEPGQMS